MPAKGKYSMGILYAHNTQTSIVYSLIGVTELV